MTSPQTPENQSASPSPGYTATFHLPDGSRLIVAVVGNNLPLLFLRTGFFNLDT